MQQQEVWIFGVKPAMVKVNPPCWPGAACPSLVHSAGYPWAAGERVHLTFPSSSLRVPTGCIFPRPYHGTIHNIVSGNDWEFWLNNTLNCMSRCEVLTHSWSSSATWQPDVVACPSCFCRKLQVSCSFAMDLVAHHGLLSYLRTF